MQLRKQSHALATDCISQTGVNLKGRRIEISNDASALSSDGGAVLLRQLDEKLGLTSRLVEELEDSRSSSRVQHSRLEQLRQRVYQIALGYEDCNDGDWLRADPMLCLSCDAERRLLSSQPSLSRFENSVSGGELNRLWQAYEQQYVDSLDPDMELVILDIDSTDDPTHGNQQLTFFHGFYDQYMYHPLLVFDGESGQLVTGLLRPGRVHASKSAGNVLSRIIHAIRARCPLAAIVVRGDSAFAMPHLLELLERLHAELGNIDYVLGIAKNARLVALAEPLLSACQEQFEDTGQFVRRFTWLSYAAKSWPKQRAIVCKVEHGWRGDNPRFVVTSLEGFPPQMIYDAAYCPRGQAENFIKDLKNALGADRLSCHRFVANAFRLFLHAVAYRIMLELRNVAKRVAPDVILISSDPIRLGQAQMDRLRLRLLKVAAQVVFSVRRVLIRLPRAFPLARQFLDIANEVAVT